MMMPELTTDEIAAKDSAEGACAVCGGKWSEHQRADIRHMFTKNPGELITPEEAAKKQRPTQQVVFPRSVPGNDVQLLNRLVEVLMEKGIISTPEGLYIAGIGQKPSGFRDPGMM